MNEDKKNLAVAIFAQVATEMKIVRPEPYSQGQQSINTDPNGPLRYIERPLGGAAYACGLLLECLSVSAASAVVFSNFAKAYLKAEHMPELSEEELEEAFQEFLVQSVLITYEAAKKDWKSFAASQDAKRDLDKLVEEHKTKH